MITKAAAPLIALEKVQDYVRTEPALILLGLVIGAGLIYKLFLGAVSPERHASMRKNFANLGIHTAAGVLLFILFNGAGLLDPENAALERAATYVGLAALIWGSILFIKVTRILVLEYLYLSHMTVEFPLLLVNLFTLLLSAGVVIWFASEIFGVRLAPILATSAVFSLVVGLALQDTLGNLFSGIALQFDPPYSIGDWIEIQNGPQRWIGRVKEISWRATLLIGLSDELVTVPNKVMGQAQISNFTTRTHPINRSLVFRLPYGTPQARVRETLLRAAGRIAEVRASPRPLIFAAENTDSWVGYKLVYFLDDYGAQWRVGDQVLSACLEELEKAGLAPASSRVLVLKEHNS